MIKALPIALITITACSGCNLTSSHDDSVLTLSDQDRQTLQISDRSPPPTDPVQVSALRIDGDHLLITVQFGGGCRSHRFALFAQSGTGESVPPRVRLHLVHDDRGDACEAYLTRYLEIDVSPLHAAIAPLRDVLLRVYVGGKPAAVPEIRYRF